jgi:hypothetical protein
MNSFVVEDVEGTMSTRNMRVGSRSDDAFLAFFRPILRFFYFNIPTIIQTNNNMPIYLILYKFVPEVTMK